MSWLELLTDALGETENKDEVIKAVQAEMGKKNKEAESLRKRMKTAEDATVNLKANMAKIMETLGIEQDEDEGDVDLESALEALQDKIANATKGGGKKGDNAELAELQKTVSQLKRNLDKISKDKEAADKLAGDERGKRIALLRDNAVLAALTEGKAVKPQTLLHVVNQSVKVGDNDELVYVTKDGDEVTLAEGVKGWLADNPEFVTGAGLPGGGTAGAGKASPKDEATKAKEVAEARNKAQAPASNGLDPWAK